MTGSDSPDSSGPPAVADGRVALVMGGSGGIGRAVSTALAGPGATVLVQYRGNGAAAAAVVKQIEADGGTAVAIQADITDERSVRRLFQGVRREFGRLDTLVNTAGVTRDGYMLMMSTDKFESVLRTNLVGVFRCCREALKIMAGQRSGCMVNVASIIGLLGWEGQANYAAAKAGVIALTRSLSRESVGLGIRVNAVAPGLIDTEMLRTIPKDVLDIYLQCIGMKRLGRAEEVAGVVAFLASDAASYMTGETVIVDGGMSRQFIY